MPDTAQSSSPIEKLRSWAVAALARGATLLTPPSSTSTETIVEVMKSLKELHAKMDEWPALLTKVAEMERSQQFLNDEFEDLKKHSKQQAEHIKVLQQQMAKRAVPLPAPAVEQDAIVISGMEESEMETEAIERVSEIIHSTLQLPGVAVVTAVRLGRQPAAEGRPRKLLVKLSSGEQAVEVLTSARRLKELNIERQANGERPIGHQSQPHRCRAAAP